MTEIILNEKEWAKKAIDAHSLGQKPYDTIVRVAKYYRSEGYRNGELRRLVEDFMIRSDPELSLVKWERAVSAAVGTAEKYPPVCISGVSISRTELEKISKLQGVLQQRLMFTLLCLAKYGNAVNPKNSGWVNIPQRDIFSLANIQLTTKRQSLMINDLWREGMVGYSCLVDNINLQVNIIDSGEIALFVDDFRNLGNQYMRYIGGEYTECEGCGVVIRKDGGGAGRPAKYCRECAQAIKASRDADRRYIDRINREFLKRSQKLWA